LRHGNARRPSNRATRRAERVLALVREKYGGAIEERFGPTWRLSIWRVKTG
jgi:hypothetical protein